jgi:putative membrane protein
VTAHHNRGVTLQETPRQTDETRPREHLANERTLLAWGRTAITFIALGFGVSRFDVFLRQLRRVDNAPGGGAGAGFSAAIGIVFVLAGLITAAAGAMRYVQARDQIENGRYEPRAWPLVILTVLMCAVGVALMVYLVVDVARS